MKGKARFYISGPITGTEDYEQRFAAAEEAVKVMGFEVLNPAKNSLVMPETATHEEYMRVCLQQESCCDAIFLLNGWENSKGARQEFEYALRHKMTIFFEGGK